MYMCQLEPEISDPQIDGKEPCPIQLLVEMIVWADRWQASGCVELCLQKLTEVDDATITVPGVNGLIALPESVKSSALCESIRGMYKKWLVKKFGDVYSAMTGEDLSQSFCALSFTAVHIWVYSHKLAVHTENDVAVGLAFLHAGAMGQQCSDDQLLKLGRHLRVCCLTTLFRRLMLPELAWFKGHATRANIFASMWDNCDELDDSADKASRNECLNFPEPWSLKERRSAFPRDNSSRSTINLLVPEAALQRMIENAATGDPNNSSSSAKHEFYWYGYFWSAHLKLQRSKFGGFISCVPNGPVPATSCVKYSCSIDGLPKSNSFNCRWKGGWGKLNPFPKMDNIASMAKLQHHMSDGFLDVRIEFEDVN